MKLVLRHDEIVLFDDAQVPGIKSISFFSAPNQSLIFPVKTLKQDQPFDGELGLGLKNRKNQLIEQLFAQNIISSKKAVVFATKELSTLSPAVVIGTMNEKYLSFSDWMVFKALQEDDRWRFQIEEFTIY